MNDLAQTLLLLSGPTGAAVVWWFKRKDDAKLRARVDECERDRAVMAVRLTASDEALARERGRVDVLVELLKKEANLG